MFNNVTFGQYYPSDSFVHRLDPRIKLLAVFAYIVVIFFVSSPIGYALAIGFLLMATFFSKIPLKTMLKSIKPLWIILIITFVINVFFTKTGTVLCDWWIFTITKEGIIQAVYMSLRLVMLIMFSSLLTLTTSPVSLTDAIESLLSPLAKIKFPAHEIAMMMSIALRFIPTLIEETDKIMKAQTARGASFDTGNVFQRAKSMIPLLIPLFVSSFRRADDLALAMESRCYRGGEGRTRMRELKCTKIDIIILLVSFVYFAGMILANLIPIAL